MYVKKSDHTVFSSDKKTILLFMEQCIENARKSTQHRKRLSSNCREESNGTNFHMPANSLEFNKVIVH